jgi:hypothetical protein
VPRNRLRRTRREIKYMCIHDLNESWAQNLQEDSLRQSLATCYLLNSEQKIQDTAQTPYS